MPPPEYVQKSIKILERVIKSPKMDPKLLTRPPIKFQRDIFESITKTTGFMKGLFNKKDIDNEALKSRDKKRDMFIKVITLLEIMTKKDLGIDADKILAGQDAEKTNLMLQLVGRLASKADSGQSSDKYVKATLKKLAGDASGSTTNVEKSGKLKEEVEPESRTKEKESREQKEPKERSRSKSRQPAGKKEPSPAPTTKERSSSKQRPSKSKRDPSPEKVPKRPPSANANRRRPKPTIQADQDEVEIEENEISETNQQVGSDIDEGIDGLGQTQNSGRPMTSRGSRPTTAKNLNDQFLVQTRLIDDENDDADILNQNDQLMIGGEHGHLVDNMLKVREQGSKQINNDDTDDHNANYEAKPIKFTSQQMKEFENKRNDLIETQKAIEKLSKSVIPLSKAADYAQEDADQMSKEHQSWRQQVLFAEKNLQKIYNKTVVKSNNELTGKIKQLEAEVEHKKAQIRSQIYQNILLEGKLNKLTEAIVS